MIYGMSTVPQAYMTDFENEIPASTTQNNPVTTYNFANIHNDASEDEGDISTSFSSVEELGFVNSETKEPVEETVTGQSEVNRTRLQHLILLINHIYICFVNVCFSTYIMVNANINVFIDVFFKFLGISQERINKKLLKQLFVLLILTLAFVHSSRKNGIYQNFKIHRLFSRHSLIMDYFHGELSLLKNEILNNEMTVVMFYAPWDRQSQNFASHYLKTAQYHHEQVTFTAINCWLPRSECKLHYKLHYYPIIVLHVKLSSLDESFVIPYNGPLSSHYLIQFINNALRPFTYISNQAELLAMQLENQAIVLGYFDLQSMHNEFDSFYMSAVRKFQHEYMSEVKFALITNSELASKLSFTRRPSIHLMLWNTTLIYPTNVAINHKNITNFIDLHMTEVCSWLRVSGRKSLALNRVFQEGPFMIIFSPYIPYHFSNGPYQLLRSVALEYYNCQNLSLQLWLTDHFYLKNRAELRDLDSGCRKYLKSRLHDHALNMYEESEKTEEINCQREEPAICSIEESNSFTHFTWDNVWSSFIESDPLGFDNNHCMKSSGASLCRNKNESVNEKTTTKESAWERPASEQSVVEGPQEDDRIAQLVDLASEEQCKRLVLGSSMSPLTSVKEEKELLRISGLSCKTNRTLRFVAMDSLLHADFAHQFGIDLNSKNNPKFTGAAIIDPEMEERYILDEHLSRNSLASFVYNFTYRQLNRGKIFMDVSSNKKSHCDPGEACLKELNGNNYMDTINKAKEAFIVLHYSHQCGACSAIGGIFLAAQHLTFGVSNLVFARIDVSKNTLPWHLTFENVPTIVFHPHDNKSYSRVFNPRQAITLRNLMSFIMSGLKPAERNSLVLKLCDAECKKAVASQSLLMRVKLYHFLNVISSKLKRCIASLVQLQSQMTSDPSNALLQSKYELLLEIKMSLNRKVSITKGKLSHIKQVVDLYPTVPSEFSNQLSYETNHMLEKLLI